MRYFFFLHVLYTFLKVLRVFHVKHYFFFSFFSRKSLLFRFLTKISSFKYIQTIQRKIKKMRTSKRYSHLGINSTFITAHMLATRPAAKIILKIKPVKEDCGSSSLKRSVQFLQYISSPSLKGFTDISFLQLGHSIFIDASPNAFFYNII